MKARELWVIVAGALFAVGLAVAGMTDPRNIVSFLDVTGEWRPTLMFVMLGAIAVHATFRGVVLSLRQTPRWGSTFPKAQERVDARLLGGAALFGVGWGMSGYCPGPALASLARPSIELASFVLAMIAGGVLVALLERRSQRAPTTE